MVAHSGTTGERSGWRQEGALRRTPVNAEIGVDRQWQRPIEAHRAHGRHVPCTTRHAPPSQKAPATADPQPSKKIQASSRQRLPP
eukprot:366029-Chlamydomonas_euryale.AAC.10